MFDTKLLEALDVDKNHKELQIAADIIKDGGLVAIPTETVYGLAADALNEQAVAKIFIAKGRPQDNPLIIHISDFSMVAPLVREIPEDAKRLAEAFWPGPLTMILPKSESVPLVTSGGLDTVAIRMPAHPIARALIGLSAPLAAPSANLSGSPSPTTYSHCVSDLSGRVDAILCGQDCTYGVESTVITLVTKIPTVLRPGAVTIEQLREVLGDVQMDEAVLSKMDETKEAASPGMKYKHYSPKANIILVQSTLEDFAAYVDSLEDTGIYCLVFTGEAQFINKRCLVYGDEENAAEQAHLLFTRLRELDALGAQTVYARCPRLEGMGLAVYNRLIRAAGFEVISL